MDTKQKTITRPVTLSGIGLHTGHAVKVTFLPAEIGAGISFVRTDLPEKPDVGLLQIQGSWATVTRNICKVSYGQVIKALTKVRCNLAVASYLYQNGGIDHWKGTSGHDRNN